MLKVRHLTYAMEEVQQTLDRMCNGIRHGPRMMFTYKDVLATRRASP